MAIGIWNLEWLNSNSQRSYPLVDTASKVDTTGTFAIPDSLILGLYFPIHSGIAAFPEQFFIKSISVFPAGVNIVLGYKGSGEEVSVASATVAVVSHTEYKTYLLIGEGTFKDCAGKIVLGGLDELSKLPPGSYEFSYAAAGVDSDAIRPMIRGISSVTLVNGPAVSKRIQGDVAFIAGVNMRITSAVSEGATNITFSAIKGEGLNAPCVCTDDDDMAGCIRSINGFTADALGRFTFAGDTCLTIEGITNGLQFTDVCSKPCCGCTELEAVTRDLVRLGDASTTLTNFLGRLEGSVNRMNLTVLGSRLGDGGTCL